jgi:hypothetical protein
MAHPNVCYSILVTLAILLSVSACVTSKAPLLGPESRVLPFGSRMKFEVYERETERRPWIRKQDATMVADQELEVRDEKDPKGPAYTFQRQGQRRFLVQGNFGTHMPTGCYR